METDRDTQRENSHVKTRDRDWSDVSIDKVKEAQTYYRKQAYGCQRGRTTVAQSLSHVRLSVTPWTVAHQVSLSFTISQSLLKLMSIKSVIPSNHLILCRPLLLLTLIFPRIRAFSNELALPIRWPKYWSLGFSISPSNEYSGLISFRIDWFDLLAVQGTFKSLLQHHNWKELHQFFSTQLSLWFNSYIHN